ncbi:MAG TPA: alpha/beta hydrolase [Thermomicrobiales bacterium]|nr:alpha/beta hydrolase [Thermomicrobiales bacterium]
MPSIQVNGVDLSYEVTGDGPPVVLTHGSWGDRRGWAAVVPGLAESFRVVTWDRRGHGESGDLPGRGTRTQDAADLAGLIEGLGIGPVHAVGNSFGGSITLELASRRPELLRSIAVHEPPVFGVLAGSEDGGLSVYRERIGPVVERLAAGEMEAGAALFVDSVVGQPGNWGRMSPEAQAAMTRLAPTFLDENLDPGMTELDLDPLKAFQQPTLLSYGDTSPGYFAAVVLRIARVLPDGRVLVFAGAGHVPHRSHPDAYVDALTGFMQALA